jgi:hypothetical protein
MNQTLTLDWSTHRVGDLAPCLICRRPALVRDRAGNPCHKVCAEAALQAAQR